MAFILLVIIGWTAAFLSSMVSAVALGFLETKLNFWLEFGYWDNVSILFAGAFVVSTLFCGLTFAIAANKE